jgi:TrmH family RNA methyltransferase
MLKLISSREHPLFKQLKQLVQTNGQYHRGQAVCIEGVHLAQAWLQTQRLPDYCITTESALADAEIVQIVAAIPPQRCVLLSDALFRHLSQLTQGISIFFLITPPQWTFPEQLNQDCVILDRIQDPGNVGSILRSSAAAGIQWVFCLTGTAAVWSAKTLRAGMGAQFQLNIVERVELDTLLSQLAVPIMATMVNGTQNIYQTDLTQPLAWAFGNEGSGLTQALSERAQGVAIPQSRQIESLNVAAAAAICLFETLRQRL